MPGHYTLLIDYAHNALSMENVLTTLRQYNPHRLITMFGAGGNRPKVRRYEMGEVSGRLSDLSVITEDNSRFEDVMDIIEDIKVGINKTGGKYVVVPNRKDAIRYCMEIAQDGDIIVLAGKGTRIIRKSRALNIIWTNESLSLTLLPRASTKNKIINIKEKSLKPNEFWLFLSLNYLMNLLTKFHLPITGSSLYLP